MTAVTEAVLAREAELCLATLCLVTDYDSFNERPVSAEEVIQTVKSNVDKARQVLMDVIPRIGNEPPLFLSFVVEKCVDVRKSVGSVSSVTVWAMSLHARKSCT